MLKQLPGIYDLDAITKAGIIHTRAFANLNNNPTEGLATTIEFREGIEGILLDFGHRWIALCDGDAHELTEWASRMELIQDKLDELDRQLAVKGSRLFNWYTVLSITGFVKAFCEAVEQMLNFNEQDKAIPAA